MVKALDEPRFGQTDVAPVSSRTCSRIRMLPPPRSACVWRVPAHLTTCREDVQLSRSAEQAKIVVAYPSGTPAEHRSDGASEEVLALEQCITSYLNGPLNSALGVNDETWSQIVAAQNAYEDAHLALAEYSRIDATEAPTGVTYLLVCGCLQEMVIQQDALAHVAEALGFADIAHAVRSHPAFTSAREYSPTWNQRLQRSGISTAQVRLLRTEGAAPSGGIQTIVIPDLAEAHLVAYRETLLLLCERLTRRAAEIAGAEG